MLSSSSTAIRFESLPIFQQNRRIFVDGTCGVSCGTDRAGKVRKWSVGVGGLYLEDHPISKWLVTPNYKPLRQFIRGMTPFRGLTNHGY